MLCSGVSTETTSSLNKAKAVKERRSILGKHHFQLAVHSYDMISFLIMSRTVGVFLSRENRVTYHCGRQVTHIDQNISINNMICPAKLQMSSTHVMDILVITPVSVHKITACHRPFSIHFNKMYGDSSHFLVGQSVQAKFAKAV